MHLHLHRKYCLRYHIMVLKPELLSHGLLLMLETYFRPLYQNFFVDPIAARIKNLSPHLFTLIGLLLGIAILPFLLLGWTWQACILLLLSGYCDTLDGTIARLHDKSSPQGCAIDIIADRIVEFAVVLALFLVDTHTRGLVCIAMLGSMLFCVTSFLVVGIFTPNDTEKAFHYSVGLMERAEAFVFFITMILFPAYFFWLGWSFVLLVLLTTVIRVWEFNKSAKL